VRQHEMPVTADCCSPPRRCGHLDGRRSGAPARTRRSNRSARGMWRRRSANRETVAPVATSTFSTASRGRESNTAAVWTPSTPEARSSPRGFARSPTSRSRWTPAAVRRCAGSFATTRPVTSTRSMAGPCTGPAEERSARQTGRLLRRAGLPVFAVLALAVAVGLITRSGGESDSAPARGSAPDATARAHGLAAVFLRTPGSPWLGTPGSRLIVGIAPANARGVVASTHGRRGFMPVRADGVFTRADAEDDPPDQTTVVR
jgi:hypothetical protein